MSENNVNLKRFHNSDNGQAMYDESVVGPRLLGAWGPDVIKFELLTPEPVDDTTGDPTRFVCTMTEGAGTTTAVNGTTAGTALLITTGTNEYDGINFQARGTAFDLTADMPCYFGIKCAANEATQSDLLVGLAGTDTTLTNASSSHAVAAGAGLVAFTKLDAVTQINFETWQTSSVNNKVAAGTLDTDAHVYEFYWDGSALYAYLDGDLVTTLTDDLPTVALTPSIGFRAGSAGAKALTVYWMRAYQVRS